MAGRILFLTSSYPRRPGDASGAFVHRLAVDVSALGWAVEVLAPHAPGLARDEVIDGVPVHRFRYSWPAATEQLAYGGGMLANLATRRWTAATVPGLLVAERVATGRRARRVDVVHAHWAVPQGLALVGRRAVPVVLSVHGSDVSHVGGRVAGRLVRSALRSASVVTAGSASTAARVRELAGVDAAVTPLGVSVGAEPDPERVAALRARIGTPAIVAVVARLVPQKGVADLVAAMATIAGAGLLVVGDGPQRAELEAAAAEHGVPAGFVGAVPPESVLDHLAAADVVVAPARGAEGQGLAVLEAMAAGRAVVATTAGGQGESIADGRTGLLVPPGDSRALSVAIGRLLADEALRDRLGAAARAEVARTATRAAAARRMVDLYEQARR